MKREKQQWQRQKEKKGNGRERRERGVHLFSWGESRESGECEKLYVCYYYIFVFIIHRSIFFCRRHRLRSILFFPLLSCNFEKSRMDNCCRPIQFNSIYILYVTKYSTLLPQKKKKIIFIGNVCYKELKNIDQLFTKT